jgi:hypothetical protein
MLPDQSAVYYPEELSLLERILDQAVQSLPLSMRTPQNRAAIAKNILACAATGERDPIELRLAALIDLKVTVAADRTPIKQLLWPSSRSRHARLTLHRPQTKSILYRATILTNALGLLRSCLPSVKP